jgi:Bacterial Ig domain
MHFLVGLVVGALGIGDVDATTAADGTMFVRQPVAPTAASAHAKSRVVYLNRWGGTLKPGVNDSRKNQSSIVSKLTQVAGWDVSDAKWAETVACMRAMWGRFDVEITDLDPGDSVQHIEAMFGDSPLTLGLPANVGGIAPMASDCSTVENAIVFAFTKNLSSKPQIVCEVMSQEIGHSYGLDHELEASDPMTYLPYAHDRTFQDHEVACGESVARPCGVAAHSCRAKQNSVEVLLERLGPAGSDHDAPTVIVSEPANHATVSPGFVVVASVSDNIAVASVQLYVDGALAQTKYAPPYEFELTSISAGGHVLRLEAKDAIDNTTETELDVYVAQDSPSFDEMVGCSAGGGAPGVGLALALLALRRQPRATTSRA